MIDAWLTLLVLTATPELTRSEAVDVLFLGKDPGGCVSEDAKEDATCLLRTLYAKDPAALDHALHLFQRFGTLAGQLEEQDFDGGYRGKLHLVPRVPTGELRRHLRDVRSAFDDFDDFFSHFEGAHFRWQQLELRYFESVKRKTPSAYATGRTVAYNVSGSLFGTPQSVRATLFHELFHLNDEARGWWSVRKLTPLYERIVKKCGVKTECLTPYTPDLLKVRGGTYYAFQPGNGVTEYAADLARRYYLEHRAVLHGEKVSKPFKCGKQENAEAWKALSEEFFGGVDLTPNCWVP